MAALATLRTPVDEFFDQVTVMDPDRAISDNRLRLLHRMVEMMDRVADFSKIEG